MTRLHHGLAVERRMDLLDAEPVLARDLGKRTARRGCHLGPDAVPGEAGDDKRAAPAHGRPPCLCDLRRVTIGISFPAAPRTHRWCGLVGVCASAARERHLPLEGENQDQLDADDARYQGGSA